jgi:hypothetical protein
MKMDQIGRKNDNLRIWDWLIPAGRRLNGTKGFK